MAVEAPIRWRGEDSPPFSRRRTERRRAPAIARLVRILLSSAAIAVFWLLVLLPLLLSGR
jgi:hypothetical protein